MKSKSMTRDPLGTPSRARHTRRLGLAAVLAVVCAWASPARADWPVARHDTRRTGVSNGTSNIQKPAVYSRTPIGGAVGSSLLYVGDVDGDGQTDVLYVAGGRLSRARADGTIVWRTSPRGFFILAGVADFDGDGVMDVAVSSSSRAEIISSATGALEWAEPAGALGTPTAFRIGDLDGDGRPDLWGDTCGCCAIETGSPGLRYSFGAGFGAPKTLPSPPLRSHCGAASNTLADIDGDGIVESITMSNVFAQAVRADGSLMGTADGLPARSFGAICQGVNLDGQAGDEVVCFSNLVYGGAGQRGVFVLDYEAAQNPPFRLLWSAEVSAADGGDAVAPARVAVDLDGDGKIEVVVGGRENGAYTTTVRDALTGVVLASAPGAPVGDVASPTPGQRTLLLSQGFDLHGYTFSRNPAGLTKALTLPNQRVQVRYDWLRARSSAATSSLVAADVDGDGVEEAVLASLSEPMEFRAVGFAQYPPKLVATHPLEAGIGASAVGVPIGGVGGPTAFVARNDGHVAFLDAALKVTNPGTDGNPPRPALYLGGYYTGAGATALFGRAPVAGKLSPGAKADSVLLVDSRGDVIGLDAKLASNAAPARTLFRLADSSGMSLRPGPNGAAIGAYRRRHPLTDPPQWVMASLDHTGSEIGSLALTKPPYYDVIPADLRGDGTVTFAGLSLDGTLKTDLTTMSATGAPLWKVPIVNVAGSMPIAVGDWDGDGADDVAAAINLPHVYSGKTGTELATGVDPIMYFMPILANVSADAKLDMVLQGGYLPPRALANDMSALWTASDPKQPYPFGALPTCANGPVLIEGSFSVSSQLSFTLASGANGGQTTSVVLASGKEYASVAAASAAGAVLGQLGDVSVSTNLDGSNSPTALVGSTDGYLYAVDACTKALRWALPLDAAVGAPILADTDGDGLDEILVTVADGYLYVLKNQAVAAPAFAWDVDPPNGVTDHDVSSIETANRLYAAWGAVPGATSYEVAVVDPDGDFVTSPAWVDVGAVTSATIDGLSLVDGTKYTVGVRATSAAGKSPDVVTNGVVVHLPAPPDAGAGGSNPTGTGGAGGSGGQGAAGGAGGSGGAGATGGSGGAHAGGSGGGSTTGAGGVGGTSAAGGATHAGGTSHAGGATHAGGTASAGGAPAVSTASDAGEPSGSGCDCASTRPRGDERGAWIAAAAALSAIATRRRRRTA